MPGRPEVNGYIGTVLLGRKRPVAVLPGRPHPHLAITFRPCGSVDAETVIVNAYI
jgi:hypothetical protein